MLKDRRAKNNTLGKENTPKITNQNDIVTDELPMYPTTLLTIGKSPLL